VAIPPPALLVRARQGRPCIKRGETLSCGSGRAARQATDRGWALRGRADGCRAAQAHV